MDIAFAINNEYIQHFLVVLKSIEVNALNDEEIYVHVMHRDFSQKYIELTQNNFKQFIFKWYDLKQYDFSDFYINAHINYETYFRVLAPEIISVEKLLYLDSDLIVRSPLKELYNQNLDSLAIAAAYDYKAQNRKEELDMPRNSLYFNAGVLFMNLEYWRKYDLSKRLIQYIREKGSQLVYWDQDALNALLYNQVLLIDDKWNVQTASFESKEIEEIVLKDPAIIHFTGASKPWHISNNNPFKSEYYRYLKLTPFKNFDVVLEETKKLLNNKKKIYIWGAGITGNSVYDYLKIDIEGFIDSDLNRVGTIYLEYPIYSIDQIERTEEVGIIVCSGYFSDIAKTLEAKGYRKNIDFVHQM